MYEYSLYNAHPLTLFIIVGSMMVTPFYLLATYAFSGAELRKGAILGSLFLVFGSFMTLVCFSMQTKKLGLPGLLIVPTCWALPSILLYIYKDWALEKPLSQHWLVGLQLFRAIGGVFLIEMARGYVAPTFAYPAGLGDILVSILALYALVIYRKRDSISKKWIYIVLIFGVADFLSAFFFGFTSSENPFQLFHSPFPNKLMLFPTGMIPLFLVPYAIFFHTLSYLNERRRV